MLECERVLKNLADQKRFSSTPAPTDRDQLRGILFHCLPKVPNFILSPNQHLPFPLSKPKSTCTLSIWAVIIQPVFFFMPEIYSYTRVIRPLHAKSQMTMKKKSQTKSSILEAIWSAIGQTLSAGEHGDGYPVLGREQQPRSACFPVIGWDIRGNDVNRQ